MLTRKILNIILFSIIPFVSIAQDKLTKKEIYSTWCYAEENRNKIEAHFDSSVVVLIDSLKILKVDTIGIFAEYSSGGSFLYSESQKNRLSFWTAYIQWVKNGRSYYQKVEKYSFFEPKKIENSRMITFYINNKEAINVNRIMPTITKASMNQKGIFKFTTGSSTSSTAYQIYCELNGNSTLKNFESYDIENEDNLFYIDNQNSIVKSWWELIEGQIAEIEKE